MVTRISIILLVTLVLSCSSQKTIITEETYNNLAGVNEEFDPLSLEEPMLVIKSDEKQVEPTSFDPLTQQRIVSESIDTTSNIYGYRVQIAATQDEEIAREIRKEAILKFSEEVYWVYDGPYFKIRIGDCTSRFEAEDLQQYAIEKGFMEAWVIRTLINPKNRSKIKEK